MKWFITDMDGTFLNDKKEVSPKTNEVMRRLQKHNINFIIATGRADIAVKSYYYSVGLDNIIISNNGSLIRNLKTGEIIFQKCFTEDEITTIYNSFKELNDDSMEFHIYTLNYIYCDRISKNLSRIKNFEEGLSEELKTSIFLSDNILEEIKKNNEQCQKVMIIAEDHDKVREFYNSLSDKIDVDGTFSATDFFDIMPKGCNKGTAIERIAEYYNYNMEDSVVFGDNFNDLEMLNVAGLSVCPSNAEEDIKKICDVVIGSNNDFSVLNYVEDYVESLEGKEKK